MALIQPLQGNRETLRRMTRFTTNGDTLTLTIME